MGTWGCFILGRDPGNAGYASRDCWVREGSSWLDGELLMLGTLRRVVDRYAGNEGDALLADVPVVMPLSEYGAVADWTEGGVGNAYWTESVQKADWVELNRLPPTWDLLPVVLSLLVGKLQTIDLALVLEMNWIPDGLHSRLCPNYGYRTNYGYRISLCYLNEGRRIWQEACPPQGPTTKKWVRIKPVLFARILEMNSRSRRAR